MADLHSPISHSHPPPQAPHSDLQLSETMPGGLLQIAGWSGFEAAATPALSTFGLEGLGDYRNARSAAGATVYRIAPDRLLLRHSDPSALTKASAALDPERACSLDLSHARWVFAIEGATAPALLARLLPIDCDPACFPVDCFVQTAVHHVGVLLHRRAEVRWELLVPVTWAQSLWDYLCEAAVPLGYRLQRSSA